VIDSGLQVSALQMFYLDRATCDEFFEVYKVNFSLVIKFKDVLPEFNAISENISKGPVIILEVR